MAINRLGPKLDLPLEAVDEYFTTDVALGRCTDPEVRNALEELRVSCTRVPVCRDSIARKQMALQQAVSASTASGADMWRAAVLEAATRTRPRSTGAHLNKSCCVQARLHEIVPGLFVGSYHPANDRDLLRARGITHVCCCINVAPRFPNDFRYKILAAEDASEFVIRPFFEETYSFIDEAIVNGDGVLVHCGAGISRAPTIAAAYLMKRLGVSALYAMQLIATIRACACPNMGFRRQLHEYERELKGGKHPA